MLARKWIGECAGLQFVTYDVYNFREFQAVMHMVAVLIFFRVNLSDLC